MTFDFEQMRLPLLGKFFLLAQNTHGRGLTENIVGDTLVLSNIDSFDNIMRVSEYWWEFALLDDAVTVRLGKQDVNTEFLFMDSAADFIQSTFGLSPSTAFPTYPNPSMGAVLLVQLSDSLRLKAGIWDALVSGGSWGFSGNDTVLVIGELEYTYALFEGTLPGTLALGAVYESDGELSGEPLSAVQEYVVQFEQLVHRECPRDEDDAQGLAIFAAYYPRFQGAWVPAESIGDSAVAGIVYTGLIPQRDKDVLGAGISWAELFQGGTNRETVFEFFYKAQVTPQTSLQPNLQYIATPSGIERDALVVGLRFQVTL
jgi:porin